MKLKPLAVYIAAAFRRSAPAPATPLAPARFYLLHVTRRLAAIQAADEAAQ